MRVLPVVVAVIVLGGWGAFAPAAATDQPASAAERDGEVDFEGLTPGLGREAVYYTCRACHSLKQFNQQRMDRDDWDATLGRMVDKNGMAEPEPWTRTLILAYLSTHFGVGAEDFAGLPPGPGREDVYYTCSACHSIRLVTQQRLARDIWDETLDWMVEEQDMPEIEAQERATILDYLATYLSATTPR